MTPTKTLLQVQLDLNEVFESKVAMMRQHLPRGYLKLWLLKLIRQQLGDDAPEAMAAELTRQLMGTPKRKKDGLEDGHKRHQDDSQPVSTPETSEPLGRPPASTPLSTPPTSEPLSRPWTPPHRPPKNGHGAAVDDEAGGLHSGLFV